MPIDAKGSKFSRAATLFYDGTRVYELGLPVSLSDLPAKAVDVEPVEVQGVEVKPGGLVMYGSAAVSSRPATVDFEQLRRATPEWRKIRAHGVKKGTGR